MDPQPPKHKGDVPSGVDVSVPDRPAVFAPPDSIQSLALAALFNVVFASNGAKITTYTLRYHPSIPLHNHQSSPLLNRLFLCSYLFWSLLLLLLFFFFRSFLQPLLRALRTHPA